MRFPEFTASWITCALGSLTKIYDGTHQTPRYVKSGVPFYSVEHLTADKFDNTKFISEAAFENESKRVNLEKGDILMTRIGSIGVSKYIDWEVRASFYVSLALIKKSNKTDGRYLNSAIQSGTFQRELWKRTIHVAFPQKINLGEIGHCIIHVPKIEEQQKIATFLSSVDTKIEQLGKKKVLLEQYKKGMMQKLFSQEIRFKDDAGNDYPGWEKVKFSSLYSFQPTNSFSRDRLNYKDGRVRNIHYGDIHTKYRSGFELDKENVPFLETGIDLGKVSEASYCKEGDLVIADASEDYSAIGKTIELLNLNGEQVLAGLHTILARLNTDRVHVGYGTYVMACYTVKLQVMRMAHGTKVLGISAGRMGKIELPLPSREEQQKIANFLSAIDRKIELVAAQIEQARSFKKGLLQQMFI